MNWPGSPHFIARAEGSRIWDVDGNEYIDMMCSWGPIVLGYLHPEVEEAVARQHALVDCGPGAAPVMVDLAERLVVAGRRRGLGAVREERRRRHHPRR